MAMIGTCLTVDDQAPVRVVVLETSVKIECSGTEIEMDPDSLAMFITTSQEGLTKLIQRANGDGAKRVDVAASAQPSTVDANGDSVRASASTWVVCDPADEISYLTLGERFELHWGRLTWTISNRALSRLLDRARRAQPILNERMNMVDRLPDDLEIPEIEWRRSE